jgi:hypothetical protein
MFKVLKAEQQSFPHLAYFLLPSPSLLSSYPPSLPYTFSPHLAYYLPPHLAYYPPPSLPFPLT